MFQTKDELERVETKWLHKAQREHINCSICGSTIPHGEQEVYYKTKMCGYCNHQAKKED
jgi:uncharacterized CHY-type Zn-finger protein